MEDRPDMDKMLSQKFRPSDFGISNMERTRNVKKLLNQLFSFLGSPGRNECGQRCALNVEPTAIECRDYVDCVVAALNSISCQKLASPITQPFPDRSIVSTIQTNRQCPICLDTKLLEELPCRHNVCATCLGEMDVLVNCPICRKRSQNPAKKFNDQDKRVISKIFENNEDVLKWLVRYCGFRMFQDGSIFISFDIVVQETPTDAKKRRMDKINEHTFDVNVKSERFKQYDTMSAYGRNFMEHFIEPMIQNNDSLDHIFNENKEAIYDRLYSMCN